MSDILIRGMEMPENCAVLVNGHLYRCPLYDADGYCAKTGREALKSGNGVKRGKPDWCPLVELPEHGRLIDADALRSAMYHEAFETDSPMQKWDSGCWIRYKMFERIEESAPTIIPASGGDEE